jgi:hypothetical protein
MNFKSYAIYFPQFYSTPVNDDAWGKGFSDWLLVGQANFRQSWRRRMPSRGFYDGSSRAVHAEQVDEALQAGLSGFAVYHYWFYSEQLLDEFERGVLSGNTLSGKDQWFLIWASESWSKRWVGSADLLIDLSRDPTEEMIASHCDHLARCFASPGYVRWRGRPLFVFYNLGYFSYPKKLVDCYRQCLAQLGFDVAFAYVVKHPSDLQHAKYMDACYLFEPRLFFNSVQRSRGNLAGSVLTACRKALGDKLTDKALVFADKWLSRGRTFSASQFAEYFASEQRAALIRLAGAEVQNILCPAWNNAPRYGDSFTMLEPATVEHFEEQLIASSKLSDLPVIVNAWNEWSEGAAIEPCAYTGRKYLDVFKRFSGLGSEV